MAPELPDFPTIALRVITDLEAIAGTTAPDPSTLPLSEVNARTRQMMAIVAEQLHLVWHARGAADIAAIDEVAHTNDVAVANAIRSLNR